MFQIFSKKVYFRIKFVKKLIFLWQIFWTFHFVCKVGHWVCLCSPDINLSFEIEFKTGSKLNHRFPASAKWGKLFKNAIMITVQILLPTYLYIWICDSGLIEIKCNRVWISFGAQTLDIFILFDFLLVNIVHYQMSLQIICMGRGKVTFLHCGLSNMSSNCLLE